MEESKTTLSFAKDIRPMFTQMDVDHMQAFMDLSDRDSVFENAGGIYETVVSGTMPPPSSGGTRWTSEMCQTFKRWKEEGGAP